MYKLETTLALARMGFNALTVTAIERDALMAAHILLERAAPDVQITEKALLQEANQLLPSASDAAGRVRLFWSTKRQTEDGPINGLADLGDFISRRAESLEKGGAESLKNSETLPGWVKSLDQHAEAYSWVIEAAQTLESMGVISMRRKDDLEKLTTIPDPDVDYSGSLLFMKAMAIYTERLHEEKPALKEQYQ